MSRPLLTLLVLAAAGAASANLFLVNSPASYLRASGEAPLNAVAIDLNANGFFAGQTVLLSRAGRYNFDASPAFAYGLTALFSSSSAILPPTFLNRVPGALAAGPGWVSPNTAVGNLSTDIPDDFEVANFAGTANGLLVTIPVGAQYIITAAEDDFFTDNNNAPELYLSIAPVPEPAPLAVLGAGATLLLRRRKLRRPTP